MVRTVAVIGTGYVGLVTSLAFVSQGHRVVCVDIDRAKVRALNRGETSFYEAGVGPALRKAVKSGLISATADGRTAIRDSEFSFLCVGTPPKRDGSMDDRQVRAAAKMIGGGLRGGRTPPTIVVKSTVRPGTTESTILPEIRAAMGTSVRFNLCVNPEFLREGSALSDATEPDRIVIGELDAESGDALADLYKSFRCPTLRCDLKTAEMIKYATNAFLATKISFSNELANLCDRFGVDWDRVVEGLSLDPRINPRFMVPGVGFGGSCFPKDVAALVSAGHHAGYDAQFLREVLALNDRQPIRAVDLLQEELGDLAGKRVAILGLAFKPGTDDVRESRALPIAKELIRCGASVVGYDPRANGNFARLIDDVEIANSAVEALRHAHGCIIQTSWPEFSRLRTKEFSQMTNAIVIDGRRTWPKKKVPRGIRYRRIG